MVNTVSDVDEDDYRVDLDDVAKQLYSGGNSKHLIFKYSEDRPKWNHYGEVI